MADSTPRMVFLGFGKYARADKIYALEPIRGEDRGGGSRTQVWVDGIPAPIVASRTERTILHDMGQDVAAGSKLLDDALAFAERIAVDAEKGRVDLGDLGRVAHPQHRHVVPLARDGVRLRHALDVGQRAAEAALAGRAAAAARLVAGWGMEYTDNSSVLHGALARTPRGPRRRRGRPRWPSRG